jgi:sulfotransferase
MSSGGVVGLPVNTIRDAMTRGVADRVVVVRYQDLASRPQEALDLLHAQLGLPAFSYDPDNVEQVTQEDDAIFGWGPDLHTIRRKVELPTEAPWAGVLPPHTCERINKEFADIQGLVYSSPLSKPAEATASGEPSGEE